jgi:6-phosphofructokinase 2
MVAGMVLSLAMGRPFREMVRYGVACGTAATMTPGSQLCDKKDVDVLYAWLLAHKGSVKKIT